MHPYWCLQDMLKSSWGKGRNSAGDLTFLLIIGEFGLQGTSGGASPTWLSKQGWIQACGNTLWMPFQVFMAGISFSWKAEIVGLNHPWLSRIFSFQNVCPEYSPSAFMPSGLSSPQLGGSANVPMGSPQLSFFLGISHTAGRLPMVLWNVGDPHLIYYQGSAH